MMQNEWKGARKVERSTVRKRLPVKVFIERTRQMEPRRMNQLVLAIIADLAISHYPLLVLAQTAATRAGSPTFEVASIRQNANPNPRWKMYFTAD